MKISSKWLLASLLAVNSLGVAFADGSYGLPAEIQQGNILHCFNWTMAEVKAELPDIAAAGYGSVQLSPLQRSDTQRGSEWHNLYRPYDIAFKSSGMGSEADLKSLCDEAAKYGIKVIVDVVANHVDRTSGYHDTWWDSNGRVRWNGGINYGDRYSITHGQLGDYGDVNSEDAEVIARAKAYVEKLKSLGVKGIRWDAAKHIGLPSEGCNFWSSVTSVSGVWHYGEILDNPGPNAGIIKEYAQYIAVTDNQYSDGAAKNNGGLPYGYGGSWVVDYGVSDAKVVYWGESHDTYSNNDGWSKYTDQSTIDRAYAAMACRNGATCLYLARPDARDFNSIRVGKGTNTAYKSKAISEVNKFRNAMIGKADYFSTSGNAISVTRQDGGAVIVMKGSGNVSVPNGGGYCPVGTYTDKVSGNSFTVTNSTITGNVGSTGIAVIYNGSTVEPPVDPEPAPDGVYCYFNNTAGWPSVYVWAWDANNDGKQCTNASEWPGEQITATNNGYLIWKATNGTPTHIIFSNGNGTQTADLVYQNAMIYDCAGNVTDDSGNDPSPEPTTDNIVYFDNSGSGWDKVYCYAWTAGASDQNAAWPGIQMTLGDDGIYSFTGDKSYSKVIFNNGNGTQTDDLQWVSGHIYKADGTHQASAIDEVWIGDNYESEPQYFNLQGVRIASPQPGSIVIERRGTKVSKKIYR